MKGYVGKLYELIWSKLWENDKWKSFLARFLWPTSFIILVHENAPKLIYSNVEFTQFSGGTPYPHCWRGRPPTPTPSTAFRRARSLCDRSYEPYAAKIVSPNIPNRLTPLISVITGYEVTTLWLSQGMKQLMWRQQLMICLFSSHFVHIFVQFR